jgi:mannose-6-phosphate isomerase
VLNGRCFEKVESDQNHAAGGTDDGLAASLVIIMNSGETLRPTLLPPNSIEHQYLGGDLIAALRGGPGGPNRPEEWLGSATTRFGSESDGLTIIDGIPLRDQIEADPIGWLGRAHVGRFGASPALLVKLLHAGQRLPVHLHPSQQFAASHLSCPFGKSEAWLVLDRDRADTTVYVGTNQPVEREQWSELMAAQDSDAMLALLNPITVDVGDGVFVPSGTPHAIGEGLLIMELQEPTDFSILLEWEGFEFDGPNDGHLDLGFDVALGAINPAPFDHGVLSELTLRAPSTSASTSTSGSTRLFAGLGRALPMAADSYFELNRAEPGENRVTLPHSFGVLLVTDGSGTMTWSDGSGINRQTIARGEAFVVPHACGPVELDGGLTAFFATPPGPDAIAPSEFDR